MPKSMIFRDAAYLKIKKIFIFGYDFQRFFLNWQEDLFYTFLRINFALLNIGIRPFCKFFKWSYFCMCSVVKKYYLYINEERFEA